MIIFKDNALWCCYDGIGGGGIGTGPGPGAGSGPGIGPGSAGGNPGLATASGGQNSGMGAGFGGNPGNMGVMPDLESLAKAHSHNDTTALAEAHSRGMITNAQFNAELQNMNFIDKAITIAKMTSRSINNAFGLAGKAALGFAFGNITAAALPAIAGFFGAVTATFGGDVFGGEPTSEGEGPSGQAQSSVPSLEQVRQGQQIWANMSPEEKQKFATNIGVSPTVIDQHSQEDLTDSLGILSEIESFDPKKYLEANQDLVTHHATKKPVTEKNALTHWLTDGRNEGRKLEIPVPPDYAPQSRFKPQEYLDKNPDVVQGGYNKDTAYDHYDQFGKNEARPGSPLAVGEYSFENAETAKHYFQNYKPKEIKEHVKAAGGTIGQLRDVANRAYGEDWTDEEVSGYLNPPRKKATGSIVREKSAALPSGLLGTPGGILSQQGPAHDWWRNR